MESIYPQSGGENDGTGSQCPPQDPGRAAQENRVHPPDQRGVRPASHDRLSMSDSYLLPAPARADRGASDREGDGAVSGPTDRLVEPRQYRACAESRDVVPADDTGSAARRAGARASGWTRRSEERRVGKE